MALLLEGTNFKVITYHNPLTFLPTQPLMSRRQVRWSEFVSQFALKWEYVPGPQNPADPLSRIFMMTSSQSPGHMSKHLKNWHKQLIGGVNELCTPSVDPIDAK
jgi:hypothetical protein